MSTTLMSSPLFRTTDLALAAYLTINGYRVCRTEVDAHGKGTFIISDQPDRPTRVLEFFNRRAEVEPLAFLDQVKTLKALLRQ
jgi:hypothetical protein